MIFIDDRVGSKEIGKYISAPTTLTRLDAGDFMFIGNGPNGVVPVGIERKTINDLLKSITSGRLSGHQLVKMSQSFYYTYLLVEGGFGLSKNGILEWKRGVPIKFGGRSFTYREVAKFLNTLMIMCDIHVWFTKTMRETGMWLTYLFNWWQKDWDKHRAHTQFYPAVRPVTLVKPPFLRRVINELEGVGWERSGDIIKEFNTLPKLIAAGVKDLQRVKGIGKVLAQRIYDELREETE